MNLIHLNIEPTNKCQLNCYFCDDRKTRPTGEISIAKFVRVLEMFEKYKVPEIRLFCSGEPLLHKHIDTLTELALQDHYVLIHSNGVALNKDLAERFIDVGSEFPGKLTMSFSVDGKTKEEYAKYRGPHLESVLRNLEYFSDLNFHYQAINIIIQNIIPYPEKKKVPEFLSQFKNRIRFSIRYPHNWIGGKRFKEAEKETFPIPCGFLQDSLVIYWNGDVPVCCTDLNGDTVFGNIFKDGSEKIIAHLDYLRELQEARKHCPPCEGCDRYVR